ncbi:MAG: V-type ATP synthase subunit D [Candidatus Omnitrophica bacterium]|nr:V-type ATP synthase subunit D [Candidatus Omnitrophota bacterium]MBU0895677.1 V-type ATP synthase subunit D [Candidatus Omnitrophota bacterium]MBU1808983.1 V-type ATP synthase subunit D [Candidatus Omnitrophota bacterium]
MPKIKLTKGELKKQRDSLRQYYRYLPTLQLKKQQLQAEILRQRLRIAEKEEVGLSETREASAWAGLLTDRSIDIKNYLKPYSIKASARNIAGIDLPVFEDAVFAPANYDLFLTPLWIDTAIEALRKLIALREEIGILERGKAILERELKVTTQRVNLFEKVKIPEAEEAIRRIKIFIGDQMTNAVGRSKIAKKKIEEAVREEVCS